MIWEEIVQLARGQGASDIHLEGGMPMALRVRGELRMVGEPIASSELTSLARVLIGEDWPEFLARCSYDLSRSIQGVRCRINVLRTARGVGFAVRLLASFQATLQRLNLHPDLRRLIEPAHGLVLICGPTGSGKTSTLAALIQEINLREARHVITVESPIEYALAPRQSFIRQREVGRDTPSFAQALTDALREDPDVLMVGEMREPEVMRLTLSAAETGHLVLATVHSSSAAEALQRVVSSFAPEIQGAVAAQLADCLVGVVSQRLAWRADLGIRVPECEILMASTAVKALVRAQQFFKLGTVLDTGANEGSWSWARYAEWLQRKTDWHTRTAHDEPPAATPGEPQLAVMPGSALMPAAPIAAPGAEPPTASSVSPAARATTRTERSGRPEGVERAERVRPATASKPRRPAQPNEEGVLELSEDEGDPESILRELERGDRE